MLTRLRNGDFLTGDRIRRISIMLIGSYALALVFVVATSPDGLRDYAGRPLGTDFSNVWAAGRMALDGDAVAVFDPARHLAKQQEIFNDPEIPLYGWHYPPFFLLIASLLALVPYTAGYLIWQAATAPLYLRMTALIAPGKTAMLAALAFPAVFVNIAHGQNGFLTAALLGGAMLTLDRRPVLAGALIGLLAYKPQLGVLIPLVLMATGRWRAFAAAAAAIITLIVVSTAVFGAGVWPAFIDNMRFTNAAILDGGGPGWAKIQSLYSALRLLGAPLDAALAVQAAFSLAVAASLIRLWRSRADQAVKAAGLIAASLLATPYVLDYDMLALGPAIAFLAAHGARNGFLPYEKSLLAAAWLAPLFARQIAAALFVPAGFLAVAGLFAVTLAHAVAAERGWRRTPAPI